MHELPQVRHRVAWARYGPRTIWRKKRIAVRARVVSPELAKLYLTLAVDEKRQVDPEREGRPVEWVQVHNLPDYVYFDHRAHVGVGVRCQTCHGPVETMERVRQSADLSMGWCVNCHRTATENGIAGKQVDASIDCVTCHY